MIDGWSTLLYWAIRSISLLVPDLVLIERIVPDQVMKMTYRWQEPSVLDPGDRFVLSISLTRVLRTARAKAQTP